jgi:hypothetical protein
LGVPKNIANHGPDELGNDLQTAIARMKTEKIMKQQHLDQMKGEKNAEKGYKIVLGGMEPIFHYSPYKNEASIENAYSKEDDEFVQQSIAKPVISRKVDLPGAAVITRNMISYDKVQKIKTTRVSSERLSDSGSYGKSTNAAGNKIVHVKRYTTIKDEHIDDSMVFKYNKL